MMRRARRSTRYMEIARVEQWCIVEQLSDDVDVTIRCKGFEGSYRLPLRRKGLGSFFPQFLHIGSIAASPLARSILRGNTLDTKRLLLAPRIRRSSSYSCLL